MAHANKNLMKMLNNCYFAPLSSFTSKLLEARANSRKWESRQPARIERELGRSAGVSVGMWARLDQGGRGNVNAGSLASCRIEYQAGGESSSTNVPLSLNTTRLIIVDAGNDITKEGWTFQRQQQSDYSRQ